MVEEDEESHTLSPSLISAIGRGNGKNMETIAFIFSLWLMG